MLTDEEIIKAMEAVGIELSPAAIAFTADFARLIEKRVRAEERESCAMLCDVHKKEWAEVNMYDEAYAARACALHIRARGES